MEIYILSKEDLKILSITKTSEYEINMDEETNGKSTFNLIKSEGLKKGNYMVVNGLYEQFLFLIDNVETEKGSNVSLVTARDISNIFDRKIIEKDTDTMTSNSIEQFIANTISENFVNSDDIHINVGYINIYWKTNTKVSVSTNAENGLYNFHTFLINCRQYKNIYTTFKFENNKLNITIENKDDEETRLVDTTLPEVTDYNKVYESEVTAKVQVLIREDNSVYNLYLKSDRTTTENKNDPDRVSGKVETISVDTSETARTEALNVMKGNTYNHLVEFKITKTSKLMDVKELHIGRLIRIKTEDDIYDSYISAITLKDENFIYFKSGNLRTTLIDKLKQTSQTAGNKLDLSGGVIKGDMKVDGKLSPESGIYVKGKKIVDFEDNGNAMAIGQEYDSNLGGTLQVDGEVLPSGIPIGSVLQYASDTIPNKYLLCNGQAVSRTTYSKLFSIIGTTYGSGNGSSTFNVPNLKTRIPVGKDSSDSSFASLGQTGGAKTHTLSAGEMPSHNHSFTGSAHTHTLNGHVHSVGAHSHGLNGHTHSIPALSGTAASAGAHEHSIRYKGFSGMNQSTGGYMVLRRNESADSYDGTDGNAAISAGAHTHSVSTTASTTGGNSGSTANSGAFNTGGNSGNTSSTTQGGSIGNTGSGSSHNNLQPYIVINYIIKAM